jgi:pimeloyl-ACP methyl ester carboxylesterase
VGGSDGASELLVRASAQVGAALDGVLGARAAIDGVDRSMSDAPGWRGPAADEARHVIRGRGGAAGALVAALEVAREGLDRGARRTQAATDRRHELLRRASSLPGLDVRSDGTVRLDALTAAEAVLCPPLAAASVLAAAELVRQADAELSSLQVAAHECAGSLAESASRVRAVERQVDHGVGAAVPVAPAGGPAGIEPAEPVPSAGTDPDDVADWWASRSPGERRSLLSSPRTGPSLGNLEGLPAVDRDRANRATLARRLAAFAGLTDQGRASLGPAARAAHAVDLQVLDALTGPRLDPATGDAASVTLLTYDPTAWAGKGRVAIAVGGLDSAANVGYLVPGLGQRADADVGAIVTSAWTVYTAARRLAGRPTVAVVGWLAYDTPDLADVAFDGAAQRGADLLAQEVHGLRATRGEAQPHVTLVGHSYGTPVAAMATERRPGSVDELVLLGSPGADADHADDLPVQPGHVWVGAASADPVSHLSRFGTDPAAASFGAHRFPAEPESRTSLVGEHTHYYDAGSETIRSLALILTGRCDLVASAPGRTDHGYLGALEGMLLPPPLTRFPNPTFGDAAGPPGR